MEQQLKERIVFLRSTLSKQGLDVDKLVAILKRDQLLSPWPVGFTSISYAATMMFPTNE